MLSRKQSCRSLTTTLLIRSLLSMNNTTKSTSLRDALSAQYALNAATLRHSILDRLREEFGYEFSSSSGSKSHPLLIAHREECAAISSIQCSKEKAGHLERCKGLVDHAKNKWIAEAEDEYMKCKQETDRILEQCIKENNMTTCSDLDADLARYQIYLDDNTISQLAEFASQGDENQMLISDLLADDHLLILMSQNDGPRGGKYGPAIEIYNSIRLISPMVECAKEASEKDGGPSIFFRLALAVSLEHALPYSQSNPDTCFDKPKFIDPIMRYLHYENAYLAGELDPAFDTLTTWELRFVVDGEHGTPDEAFSWGREMLRNYRPDLIMMEDYTWRYVHSVRTEIKYGTEEGKFDRNDLYFFQNVLMNGGVCGRWEYFSYSSCLLCFI